MRFPSRREDAGATLFFGVRPLAYPGGTLNRRPLIPAGVQTRKNNTSLSSFKKRDRFISSGAAERNENRARLRQVIVMRGKVKCERYRASGRSDRSRLQASGEW